MTTITVPQEDVRIKWAEMLVKHGFIHKEDERGNRVRGLYRYDSVKKVFQARSGAINPDHAMQEYAENIDITSPMSEIPGEYIPTSYPSPLKRYHLVYENFSLSIEETYFWLIDHIRYDQGFTRAYKVRDIFTATENSAFFGNSQQRLGIQQDRVQQYLATIGKMVKDLFQLVREMRILDEKLQPRREWKNSKSADVTLKGDYIDLVENRGGQTGPGSVYGLAQQLGYASLPDLFFNTHVYGEKEVESEVEKLKFNKTVKNVLKRKLYQFVVWKKKTDHELESRRRFTLKYLRQHWDVIEMYMSWVKPYLRHITRLQMNEDKLLEPDLISAFEQSYIETEVVFAKPAKDRKWMQILMLTIDFRTRPNMSYVQEGYQKGPIHIGRADIYLRNYYWLPEHIDQYVRYRQEEDLYMLGVVDKSVRAAMEALGDELEQYLGEAGEPKYKEKVEAEQAAYAAQMKSKSSMFGDMFEPFTALFDGFRSLGGVRSTGPRAKKKKGGSFTFPKHWYDSPSVSNLNHVTYQTQKNYKKSHGMLSWG